jgi:hypothetical protein
LAVPEDPNHDTVAAKKKSGAPEFHTWHMRLMFKIFKVFVFNPILGFG